MIYLWYHYRLDHPTVYGIEFLHGCINPTVAVLHKGYKTHIAKAYELNLRYIEFGDLTWSKDNVDTESKMLIAVPSPIEGVLIVGSKSIVYYNGSYSVVELFLSKSSVDCYTRMDEKGLVYLLGCSWGQLYRISLTTEETDTGIVVKHIKIELMGEIVIPASITCLGNDLAFIGSSHGASQLVRLEPELLALERFPSLAPVKDMVAIRSLGQGQCQIVTCCGSGKEGSLNTINSGIGIIQHNCIDLPGVNGIWSLKVGTESSPYENTLVLAFMGRTRFLTLFDKDVEETDIPGFTSELESLLCFNIDDLVSQL